MSDRSAIEWTDASWNPIRARVKEKIGPKAKNSLGWHCEHVSPGCINCYAEGINKRLGTGLPFKPGHRADIEIFLDEKMLLAPLRWKRPRRIFVGSMTDLFAEFVTDEMLDKIFAVMALCPQHTFQVLTKRSARMRRYLTPTTEIPILGRLPLERVHFEAQSDDEPWPSLKKYGNLYSLYCSVPWPLPNVWCGVSVERQQEADERIPLLLQTPAAVRFISAEPLLGAIDLIGTLARYQDTPGRRCAVPLGRQLIDWVIVGGESGPHARPMHPQWARDLRDQCAAAGVAYFFKQWGEWAPFEGHPLLQDAALRPGGFLTIKGTQIGRVGKKTAGRLLDGREHNDFPTAAFDHQSGSRADLVP